MTWLTDCSEPSQTFRTGKAVVHCIRLVLGLLLICSTAWAVEFRDVRWGFNGTIKRHEFNLCTVELFNPDAVPFQGPVELRPSRSIYTEVPLIEPDVYIGPGETRTIQFLPFVGSDAPEWEVRWGAWAATRAELPRPVGDVASSAVVQFVSPQSISSPIQGLPTFPEQDFPNGGPGTEVLGTVVLDHVPRWDELRRQAFRDWLGQGGQLYLLSNLDGKHLEFPAPLEELNIAADRFQVGQGIVIRNPRVQNVAEIPVLVASLPTVNSDPATDGNFNNSTSYDDSKASGLSQLFQNMQARVRPNHNWPLIFFLAVIYLLILFPGIWLFSRKRGDFRVTYAAILGTVALFSLFYAEIGKRGYDESTGLHQMIIAEPLGNQRLLLRSYSNLFVTEGGEYQLTPRGDTAVITLDAGGHDAARFSGTAAITGRPKVSLVADIPPFSSCSFQAHSVLATTADYSLVVDKFEFENGNLTIEARSGAGIPQEAQVYFVTDSKSVIKLAKQGDKWVATGTPPDLNSLFPVSNQYRWSRPSATEIDQNMLAAMVQISTHVQIVNQYNYGNSEGAKTPTVAPQKGFLVALCPAPAEILSEQFAASGTVLFLSRAQAVPPANVAPAATP